MLELQGPALLAAVTTLTSLGFLMIGYDNGLLGGLGGYNVFADDIKDEARANHQGWLA